MPYITGEDPGTDTTCRELNIPDDLYFIAAVSGALLELTNPANWEQFGSASPADYAALAETMLAAFQTSEC